MRLIDSQDSLLKAIANFVRARGRMPFVTELAEARGVTRQAQWQQLETLRAKGLLTLEALRPGTPAQIELTPPGLKAAGLEAGDLPNTLALTSLGGGVPLVGYIGASPLSTPDNQDMGMLPLPSEPGAFALVVDYLSMADYFLPGDVVVCRKVERLPRPGEVCAVYAEDEAKSTLKYVTIRKGVATLRPHNEEFQTVEMPAERLRVEGVYRYMLRGNTPEELLRTLGVRRVA